ncbi:hypothetical protein V2G26_011111 [Clonostachys chloroleuca]
MKLRKQTHQSLWPSFRPPPSFRTWLAISSILVIALFSSPADAALPTAPADRPNNPRCAQACMATMRMVQFTDEDPSLGFQGRVCGGSRLRTSYYLCMRTYCTPSEGDEAADEVKKTCREVLAGEEVPGMESVAGYTDEEVENVPKFGRTGFEGAEGKLNIVVVPDTTFFGLWFDTLEASHYINGNHHAYGWAMGFFWAGVVAVGMINKAIGLCMKSDRFSMPAESAPWRLVKRTIGLPATFGVRHAQSYGIWATVPPRIESITIALFVLLNIVLSVIGYTFFPGNMYYPKVRDQVLRWVADRTGIISFANFPLIWLFGMRNNLVLWLTGWDFATFNNFHRWVARVATVQAIIHSILYTMLIFYTGGWRYFLAWWTQLFWWTGEIATVALSALMGFSFYWLRRKQYEFFLFMHIVLSIVVLVTMLGHVSIFEGEYDALVWVPVIIWVLDRVMRTGRILVFNARFWNTRAQATFNDVTNMVRLEVPCSTSAYKAKPGTYYFLMVLNSYQFWESHPFTVATTTSHDGGEKDNDNMGEGAPLLENSDESPDAPNTPLATGTMTPSISATGDTMTFLIRPYDSFTGRLRDAAAAAWPKPATIRVAVEGPYGHTQPLHRFDHVLFIVGGSGIVVPLSYLRRLREETPRPKTVHIHWTVREPALAEEVLRRDFAEALGGEGDELRLDVYLTSSGANEVQTLMGGRSAGLSRRAVAGRAEEEAEDKVVQYHHGRVDVRRVLVGECENATGSSLAVISCGPSAMQDGARQAVVQAMGVPANSSLRIEYFEESFTW